MEESPLDGGVAALAIRDQGSGESKHERALAVTECTAAAGPQSSSITLR